jgi:beta-1,2-N-acetylglucosaminyltransferase
MNMNPGLHEAYFKQHAFNRLPNVTLRDVDGLKRDRYEQSLVSLLTRAIVLNHNKSPCDRDFVPQKPGLYVMYIKKEDRRDVTTWLSVAKCFNLWDIDSRGSHQGLWRFFINNSHLLVVGVPDSPYSSFKPKEITPISVTDENVINK